MSDVVNVDLRSKEEEGTSACRRLRKTGFIPAVLYGHKEAIVNLKCKPEAITAAIKAGHKVVDLKGAVNESALLKAVQWDSMGDGIVHIDFAGVSLTELVRTRVTVELRGEAAGVKAGGVLKFVTHELDIESPASAIPEKIVVLVKELQLEGVIFARDLKLPENVKLAAHADDIIVSCDKPVVVDDEALAAPGAAEPELIRKEKADDEEKSE